MAACPSFDDSGERTDEQRARQMVQQAEVFTARSDNLGFIPETKMVEGKK